MISKLMVGLIVMVTFIFSGAAVVNAQKPTDAVESAQSESPGIQTDLLEVRRMSDNTIRLRWRWRNTTDKPVAFYNWRMLVEGTYLLDPVNKKKHIVVRDANNNVIASALGNDQTIAANQTMMVWARFPAPPAGVNKITVVIGKTVPFEDVAISK